MRGWIKGMMVMVGLGALSAQAGALSFKSESGDLSGEFGGRVIMHGRLFADSNPKNNSFYAKEVFLDTKGKIQKIFEYKLEGNFAGSSATLADGWLAWKVNDYARFQFGQFKLPVVQEVVNSASAIDFPERPMIERLGPSRDIGIMLNGSLAEKDAFTYALGIANGSGANTSADTNDDKDAFGRIGIKPFHFLEVEDFGTLEIAGAGQVGNNSTAAAADITSPASTTTVLDFNASTSTIRKRSRVNPQLFWTMGPGSLSAEWCRQGMTVTRSYAANVVPIRDGVNLDAWYVGGSYYLTGEDKKVGGLPKVKSAWTDGGWGAWEVALRYGQFNPDQKLFHNWPNGEYAIKQNSAEKMDEIHLGVNFYPVNGVRFSLAWVHNDFDTDLQKGTGTGAVLKDEDVILTRFQVMF